MSNVTKLVTPDYAVVPREPTVAMQEAVARIPIRVGSDTGPVHIPTAYVRELLSALISAAEQSQ